MAAAAAGVAIKSNSKAESEQGLTHNVTDTKTEIDKNTVDAVTAVAVDAIATAVVKEIEDIPRKKIPLPINNEYEWIITHGDLDLLASNNKNEVVVFKKKILKEKDDIPAANAQPPVAANVALAEPDVKEAQEKIPLLDDIIVGNCQTYSSKGVEYERHECKASSIYILITFKDDDYNIIKNLSIEFLTRIPIFNAAVPDPNHIQILIGDTPHICHATNFYREELVQASFEFWVEKGILSKADADYFMKICGHKPITSSEQNRMHIIDTALAAESYDEVITELQVIHAEAIKENQEKNVFLATFSFDHATAAYDIGQKLSILSPLHALKAFAILNEGSPIYYKLGAAVHQLGEKLKKNGNFKKNSQADRRTILALFFTLCLRPNLLGPNNSFDPEILVKAVNLIFDLVALHTGLDNFQQEKSFFKHLSKLDDTSPMIGNIILIANRLYDLNTKKTLHPAPIKGVSVEQMNVDRNNIKTKTESEEQADVHGAMMVASAMKASVIEPTKKIVGIPIVQQLPALPQNWRLIHGDWKKFSEDKSDVEFIVLEIKTASNQVATSDKKAGAEALGTDIKKQPNEKQKIAYPFSKVIIARLKRTYVADKPFERKEQGDFIVNIILLAPDPTIITASAMPSNYFDEEETYHSDIFGCFESSPDFLEKYQNFSQTLGENVNGIRTLCFRIGTMREAIIDKVLLFLENKMLKNDVGFIRELVRPWTKKPSNDEITLTNTLNERISAVHELQGSINHTKADIKEKDESRATSLIQQRNLELDKALQIAKRIHDLAKEENQKIGNLFVGIFKSPSPLDDADAAIQLGTAISIISPRHAYQAFEIANNNQAIFAEQAYDYMGHIAIDLACSSTTEAERRFYREKALLSLAQGSDDNYILFLNFLEIQAGYEELGDMGLFKSLKNQHKSFSLDLFWEILMVLCDKFSELNNKMSAEHSNIAVGMPMIPAYRAALEVGGASSNALVMAKDIAVPHPTAAAAAGAGAGAKEVSNTAVATFSAAAKAAAQAVKPKVKSDGGATASGVAKSLEDSDNESDPVPNNKNLQS